MRMLTASTRVRRETAFSGTDGADSLDVAGGGDDGVGQHNILGGERADLGEDGALGVVEIEAESLGAVGVGGETLGQSGGEGEAVLAGLGGELLEVLVRSQASKELMDALADVVGFVGAGDGRGGDGAGARHEAFEQHGDEHGERG